MAATNNPVTPVLAPANVPPPALNLPWVRLEGNQGYLSTVAIEFLQTLWSSLQGTGGIIDTASIGYSAPGLTNAAVMAAIQQVAFDSVLLQGRPAIPSIQALLDSLGGAQGDILYRGVDRWLALAPGTAGQFLKTNGAGADPAWAAGAPSPAPTTFAGLPATPSDGDRGFITDGSVVAAGNFGTVAAGGGTNHVPVYYDGGTSNWRVG